MKQILLTSLIIFSNFLNAQELDLTKNQISEVLESTLNSNQIYANAKEWVAKTFGDYKSVLQFEDNENKKIIIKGKSTIYNILLSGSYISDKSHMNYVITIEAKDKKFRYLIEDILFTKVIDFGIVRPITHTPQTIDMQLSTLDIYKEKIKEIENSLKSEVKKSKIKKLNSDLKYNIKSKNEDELILKLQQEKLKNISNSLKESLNVNNDW